MVLLVVWRVREAARVMVATAAAAGRAVLRAAVTRAVAAPASLDPAGLDCAVLTHPIWPTLSSPGCCAAHGPRERLSALTPSIACCHEQSLTPPQLRRPDGPAHLDRPRRRRRPRMDAQAEDRAAPRGHAQGQPHQGQLHRRVQRALRRAQGRRAQVGQHDDERVHVRHCV